MYILKSSIELSLLIIFIQKGGMLYKEENLKIASDTMREFNIEKFCYATVEFNNINSIYIKGFLSSTEVYAISSMISKFILEKDGSLESFSV